MLKKRVFTSLVLIPLVLLAIYYLPQHAFELLLGVIMLGCAWEWTALMHMNNKLERILYLVVVGLLCYAVTWIAMGYFLYAVMCGIAVLIYIIHHYQKKQGQLILHEFWWYIIGMIMLVSGWYSINIIRFKAGGGSHVLMLLLLVWVTDITAYFVGTHFGKNKLAPLVSPNKSWEGLKGAALAVFLLTVVEGVFYKTMFPVFLGMLLVNVATFVCAIYGDLFESMLKRMSGAKDSGGLLPGHGGLLDRLDSLFFAAPCYATGLLLMMFYFR